MYENHKKRSRRLKALLFAVLFMFMSFMPSLPEATFENGKTGSRFLSSLYGLISDISYTEKASAFYLYYHMGDGERLSGDTMLDGNLVPGGTFCKIEEESGTVTLPGATKEDYEFVSWYFDEGRTRAVTGSSLDAGEFASLGNMGSLHLYSKFIRRYNIHYQYNDVDIPDSDNPNPSTYEAGVGISQLQDPRMEIAGYRFSGWYNDGVQVTSISADDEGNKTLEARFVPETYTISYELDGGTNSESNPASYTYGTGVTSFADASKTGYSFEKWSSDSNGSDSVTSISSTATGNKTLYAIFEAQSEPATYTITYELNGGTVSGTKPESYTYGTAVVIPAAAKGGNVFAGWSTDNTSAGILADRTIPADRTGNIRLYAIFTPVYVPDATSYAYSTPEPTLSPTPSAKPKPVVSFAPGKGSGTMDPLTAAEGSVTLPECTFTAPEGCVFDGWTDQKLKPGAQYAVGGDVTLTAQWKELKITVTAPEFEDVKADYEQPEAKPIVIKNDSDVSVKITGVKFSGDDAASFILNKTGGVTIAAGGKDETYTIRPAAGLEPGREYTATITVEYAGTSIGKEVTFFVEGKELVFTPEASLPGGDYTGGRMIALTCDTKGADIYYTTDGSDPLTSNTRKLYESEIAISETATLKAAATKSGMENSEILSETYNITAGGDSNKLSFDTSALRLTEGYSLGGPIKVTFYNGQNDKYTGKIMAEAVTEGMGDVVYVKKTAETAISKGFADESYSVFLKPGLKAGTYIISIYFRGSDGKAYLTTSYRIEVTESSSKTNAPEFSLRSGTYGGAQEVSMTCINTLTNIYYTKDGTDPATSDTRLKYSGSPVRVAKSMTLKAIAQNYRLDESDVTAADYVIKRHFHNWRYEASGATITRTCANKDGLHKGALSSSLTIKKPAIADGNDDGSEEATFEGDMGLKPSIVYKKGDKVLSEAPIEPGTYTASFSMGGQTASVEYTLDKYYINPATFELEETSADFDGKEHTVKVKNVMLRGKALTEGVDFTVSVADGRKLKVSGSYGIVLKGEGKYCGTTSLKLNYQILKSKRSTATAKVQDIDIHADETRMYTYRFNNDKGEIGTENALGKVTYTLMRASCSWYNGETYDIGNYVRMNRDTGAIYLVHDGEQYYYKGQTITITCLIRDEGDDECAPVNLKATFKVTLAD